MKREHALGLMLCVLLVGLIIGIGFRELIEAVEKLTEAVYER